jgi:hypothetical protein
MVDSVATWQLALSRQHPDDELEGRLRRLGFTSGHLRFRLEVCRSDCAGALPQLGAWRRLLAAVDVAKA